MVHTKYQTEISDVMMAHYSFYNRDYVSGEDIVEREFLIRQLAEVYTNRSEEEIERALGYACRVLSPPRKITELMTLIEDNIGKV